MLATGWQKNSGECLTNTLAKKADQKQLGRKEEIKTQQNKFFTIGDKER